MPPRHSRLDRLALTAWAAWCAWAIAHYFTAPHDPFSWREQGELFPPPYAQEALLRLTRGIVGAASVTVAAWALGMLLLRRIRPVLVSGAERVIFELALGFGTLSVAFLSLAFAGAYRPQVLRICTATLAVIGAALLGVRIRRHRWHGVPWLRKREAALAACALVACLFALAGALAPETEYDALWYHLWLPSRWLTVGCPVDIVTEYVSLYPLAWELLFGAAMTMGGDVAAKLLHFECLVFAGITAGLFSRRWFGTSGVVAAALTTTAPLMIWEGTTAYLDLAVAWYVVIAVYALVRHDETRDARWLILAALTMGVALAIKNLALIALAAAGIGLLARELTRNNVKSALRIAFLFGLIAIAVPSPWYARAWVRSGNPVFPDLYPVFGARPAERWDADTERELRHFKERFGRERSVVHFVELPWDVTMHGARYGGTLGPVFLLLIPVALAAAIRRRDGRDGRDGRVLMLSTGLFTYVALWASPVSSFQLRFLVPVVPLLATLAAEGMRRLPGVAWALVPALLVLNLPPFTSSHEADRQGWTGWLTHTMRLAPLPVLVGAESEDQYLSRKVPSFRAWSFIDEHATPGARVLTFTGGDHFYSHTARISSETPVAREATWGTLRGHEDTARGALYKLGITHVLVDKRLFADPQFPPLAIASPAMRECCLERIYDDGRFAVYRVR